jgi:MFS family permease
LADAAPDPGGQYREAINSYRTAAQWVVSSFAALAAAFVAGVPLSSLGQLHGWRLAFSIACVAVVFAAVLLIIRAAVPMLSPIRGSYKDFGSAKFELLRTDLARDNEPLRRKTSGLQDLVQRYEDALVAQEQAWAHYQQNPEDGATAQGYLASKELADELDEIVMTVTRLGLVLNAQEIFRGVIRTIYVAIAVAAIAAVSFAYLSNPPAKDNPTPAPKVNVTVSEPSTCAGLYLTLDQLARHPGLAQHWPASSMGPQASACGLGDKHKLERFLRFLAHR